MNTKKTMRKVMQSMTALCIGSAWAIGAPAAPAFVPWPKSVEMREGSIQFGTTSRILSESPALEPLAKVLAEEIR
jgi:hypothetical protein